MVGEEEVTGTSNSNDLQEGAGETVPLKSKENFEQRPHPEWTYFIRDAVGIKIGRSIEPRGRMRDLQIGNGGKLELLLAVPFTILTESAAHFKFRHLKIHHEWFRPEQELLDFIETLKAETKKPAHEKARRSPRRPGRVPKPAKADPVIAQLHALRSAHGSDSRIGHCCSNLAEMIPNYKTSTNPDQRTRLATGIEQMSAKLKNLTAQFN